MRSSTLIAILLAVASVASATTLQRLSLEDLARESTAVVRGRVARVTVDHSGSLLYTVARVEVETSWKGAAAESIEVSSPGGVWQGMEQRFPGAPRLQNGQEYILFLWRGPSGRVQLTGFSQGVFEIYRDNAGMARVRREAVSEELLLPDGNGPQAASQQLDLPLSELDRLLRQALEPEEPAR